MAQRFGLNLFQNALMRNAMRKWENNKMKPNYHSKFLKKDYYYFLIKNDFFDHKTISLVKKYEMWIDRDWYMLHM